MSYLSVLIASLLGSPHCALMCGGFAGVSAQSSRPRMTQSCYHIGRLVTYSTLGILAGFLGSSLNATADKFGISNFAAVICGASLIASALLNLFGKRVSHTGFIPFKIFNHLNSRVVKTVSKGPLIMFLMGIFSTLLPCGWLYTYLSLAAATGSADQGLLLMCFFWLGTLPMLLSIGELSKLLSDRIKKRVPVIVSILILIAGFITIRQHFLAHNHHVNTANQQLICG